MQRDKRGWILASIILSAAFFSIIAQQNNFASAESVPASVDVGTTLILEINDNYR